MRMWLAKIAVVAGGTAPIGRENPLANEPVQRRMGPVGRVGDEAVFGWVIVNIVDMAAIIRVVPDGVLPKATLP